MIRPFLTATAVYFLALACAMAGPLVTREAGWFGTEHLTVAGSARVPFRLAVVADPPRLVVDVKEPDALDARDSAMRSGILGDGWQRLIVDLDGPKEVISARYLEGTATLRLDLVPVSNAEFSRQAAALVPWPLPAQKKRRGSGALPVILIDPGHGGIDPGAIRDGVEEKTVALAFATELARAIGQTGRFQPVLTRDDDRFLTLNQRVGMARELAPALFLSLHANTVVEGDASGVVVYVPSDKASDPHSAALAALENRADGSAALPVDTLPADVRNVVLDLAQPVTRAKANAAAEMLVVALMADNRAIRSRPLRSADFRVLSAPDVPSLLVELGFLSDTTDLRNLQDPVWRADMAGLLAKAILTWSGTEGAELSLIAR